MRTPIPALTHPSAPPPTWRIELDLLDPNPYQPRSQMDEGALSELVASVRDHGLLQEASLRQVFRDQRNQRPFSVNIDEFGSFADRSIIDSLNKLREANICFTLSHRSFADLEFVSKEFAKAV